MGRVEVITSSRTYQDVSSRIAQVKLHYVSVDDSRNVTELGDPTEVPTASIDTTESEGIVHIADSTDGWAKTVTNYDYSKAMMGDAASGTQITGMRVNKTTSGPTTSYTLQYTTDENVGEGSTWDDIPADVSNGHAQRLYTGRVERRKRWILRMEKSQ